MSKVTYPPARVASAAPKVAPASREASPPGSADPPGTSAVCAVDAELRTALGTDMMEEPLKICSSICSGEGSPETLGRSSRCSESGFGAAALPLLSVALCRLIASKTLPIDSPQSVLYPQITRILITVACGLARVPQLGAP